MRLEFNIAFVDDEHDDANGCDHLNELIDTLRVHIENKGFSFNYSCFSSVKDFFDDFDNKGSGQLRRIDLYISDYNLEASKTGIDLYLELKKRLICDFILYSKANNQQILDRLIGELNNEKEKEIENKLSNPNLFSRFSFVSRNAGTEWHDGVTDILEHLISSREEMNTIRGLFAHITSRVYDELTSISVVKEKLGRPSSDRDDLLSVINIAAQEGVIGQNLQRDLHKQRKRRNEIVHNDENFDHLNGEYFIPFDVKIERQFGGKLYLKDFQKLRIQLKKALKDLVDEVQAYTKDGTKR